jgi:UDP-2,4-diacetamido-2,4,6-trideoxy-beta-L-altropyranose hydrolase
MPSAGLLIRADANAEIGIGHLMRCVALGQAWRDIGGRVTFALAEGGAAIHERLLCQGFDVCEISANVGCAEDAVQTAELCVKCAADWLVLDGYHFSQDYRADVRRAAPNLLLVDDHGEFAPYNCDVVLNPSFYASDVIYSQRQPQTCLLLGPRYALLRREFVELQVERADVPETATRLLVTFGGADPHNVTLQVVEALQDLEDLPLQLTVVLGTSNPHRASVEMALKDSSHTAQLLFNVDHMPELMARSDLAISAGGGTCYELAFLRVPMFLITIARNQEQAVEAYRRSGAAVTAGWFSSLDRKGSAASLRSVICDRVLRRKLVENAGNIVDGKGARRVVEAVRSVPTGAAR